MTFEEISSEDVKAFFPPFYGKGGRYFEMMRHGFSIGFIGVRETLIEPDGKGCELELFIFSKDRNSLTKGIILNILEFPRKLNFDILFMRTKKKTVEKLLRAMKRYGVDYIGEEMAFHLFRRKLS
jgi:hypothetical protein